MSDQYAKLLETFHNLDINAEFTGEKRMRLTRAVSPKDRERIEAVKPPDVIIEYPPLR